MCVCLYRHSVHCVLYTVSISHISRPGLSPAPRENQYDVSFLLTTSSFWDAKGLVTEATSCSGVLAGKLTVAQMVSLLTFNGTRIFLFCHIYLNVSFVATYLLLPVLQAVSLFHFFCSDPYMHLIFDNTNKYTILQLCVSLLINSYMFGYCDHPQAAYTKISL